MNPLRGNLRPSKLILGAWVWILYAVLFLVCTGSAEDARATRFTRTLVDDPKDKSKALKKPIPIMVPGAKTIFLLDNGVKHHIPDWDTFVNMGFGLGNIKYLTQEEWDAIPEGTEEEKIADIENLNEPQCPCESVSRKEKKKALEKVRADLYSYAD